MTPGQARQGLLYALRAAGLRTFDDPGGLISPPGVVVGPATLTRTTPGPEPDEASFSLFAVVEQGERAVDALFELELAAVTAIEDAEDVDAVIRTSEPGTFLAGNTNLPCYIIRTEVAL